jgi:branched-chain amino acid transport system permease protein
MDPLYLQAFFGGLTAGSIYAMIALGFTLVYRSTTVINFAHGEFVMLGALLAISAVATFKLPLAVSILIAVALSGVIGVIFERLMVNPVRRQPPFVLILITLGASALFRGIAMVVWGKDALPLPSFTGGQPIEIAGASLLPQVVWIVAGTALTVALLSYFLNRTIWGKALRACAENPHAAGLVGIDVPKMVRISFLLSAAIGGLAGVLITPVTTMDFQAGFLLAMKGLTGAIIGGLERVSGVVAGAILLGLIESYSSVFVSSLMKDAVAFLVLIVVLYLWPRGIFGQSDHR